MDETYSKVKAFGIIYRAVDRFGNTIDFMLSEKRDKPAAKAFFDKAIKLYGIPEKVTMDKSGANLAGIELHHMLRKNQHVNAVNQSIFSQFYALAG